MTESEACIFTQKRSTPWFIWTSIEEEILYKMTSGKRCTGFSKHWWHHKCMSFQDGCRCLNKNNTERKNGKVKCIYRELHTGSSKPELSTSLLSWVKQGQKEKGWHSESSAECQPLNYHDHGHQWGSGALRSGWLDSEGRRGHLLSEVAFPKCFQ